MSQSRPTRFSRLDTRLENRILLARRRRWGPHQLSYYLGVSRSMAYKVMVRNGYSHLSDFDRPQRQPIRYVKDQPGELIHIDVEQLDRIPDGGGWRIHGRGNGTAQSDGNLGYYKLRTAIDDHTRLAYVRVHSDEKGTTCTSFLAEAVAWFAEQDVTVDEVMTDNAKNYTISRDFQTALADADAGHITTRPFRPQTNGKVKRFNRTLFDEFAYARIFTGNQQRIDALPRWVR